MSYKHAFVFGDSMVNGSGSSVSWPEVLRKEFVVEGPGNPNTFYSLGVDGDTSTQVLQRANKELEGRLNEGVLNYFVLAVGLNDSLVSSQDGSPETDPDTYRQNLERIIRIFEESRASGILFVGIPPVAKDEFKFGDTLYSNDAIGRYNNIMKGVADGEALPFVDLYDTGLNSETYIDSLWANDAVHPTSTGQQWMADQIRPEFVRMTDI